MLSSLGYEPFGGLLPLTRASCESAFTMTSEARTLAALLQRASIDDHEEILRACNASLKQSKKDLRSLHAKVVALLKLDRYEDALHVLEDGGESLKDEARLERSYALYKTGQLAEAERIAQRIDDDRGARHVEAQAVCVHQEARHASTLY